MHPQPRKSMQFIFSVVRYLARSSDLIFIAVRAQQAAVPCRVANHFRAGERESVSPCVLQYFAQCNPLWR